jgi:PAS domain S-box-containing protein
VERAGALAAELEELRLRLAEAEETIEAIRTGAVDAFLIHDGTADRVYTLQTADKPYRVLVETMQQGALVCDAAGTILFANARIAELLHVPHERVTGHPLRRFIAEPQRTAFDVLLSQCRDTDARGELALERSDGLRVPAHLTIARLPTGEAAAYCVIVTDLTREKEHEALERSEELLRLREQGLQATDRRKDEFLATLAHELRTPLAPIRSALEVLRLKGGPASPDIEWAQDVIDRQVQRMARLVDDLLDLSRIAHDQLVLQRGPVDVTDVIRAALESTRPIVEAQGHEVRVVMPDEPVIVDGDGVRLAQVFANLLDNAATFSDRFATIEVTGVVEDGAVRIAVKDNGRGIPSDVLPHVFDMFFKADDAGSHEHSGLGLGLPLVQKLVGLHGGTVSAHSEGPGQGSEFVVRLPLAGAMELTTEERRAVASATAVPLRVLVVDDNVDGADALAVLLRMLGYEVRTAYDGPSAIETGRDFEPQVILMDIGMPGTDGLETCRAIRAQPWGEDTHIIAVTGWGQPEDRRKAAEAGFDHHLVKPVDPARLTQLLTELGPRRATPWPEIRPKDPAARRRVR